MEIKVSKDIVQDAINIKNRVYAPLYGFLRQNDFQSVLNKMRLSNGEIWSMPIVVDISGKQKQEMGTNKRARLIGPNKETVILDEIEIYSFNKEEWAKKIYGTLDRKHPGVDEVLAKKEYLLGGKVLSVYGYRKEFPEHNFTPGEAKEIFQRKGWKTIGAFQTRNAPHRAHEFLQKYLLEQVDGLLIQPVVGEKKLADFKDEYIIASYEILLEKYFSKDRALLAVLPLKMRYAGPREALMHAIIRRNFGCTHFMVGRDHAGVGDYYSPKAAQDIFTRFSEKEIGIKIIRLGEVVYNATKKEYCFFEESSRDDIIKFSGTKIRKYLKDKKEPPAYLMRPEVYNFLANSYNSLVDNMYQKQSKQSKKNGFVLWFTGLSAAGKTSIADKVYENLNNNGNYIERLDGDVVRENLTKDLGFSQKDRDENIRRIGFIAHLLSRNGVAVLASFISPYQKQRDELRRKIENFIEIFVDTPLEVCEARDPKGLYKKARIGEIPFFTGITDPYERPNNPEIHLKADKMSVEECAQKVEEYLKSNGFID